MKETIDPQTYENLVLSGHSVDYSRISLSPYDRLGKTWYQVHSDDYRNPYSRLFKYSDDAVDAFDCAAYGERGNDDGKMLH